MSRLFLFFPVLFNSPVRPAETDAGSYRRDFPDESLGHSSIQITADKYEHLVSRRNVDFIDRLDEKTTPQESASQAQVTGKPKRHCSPKKRSQVLERKALWKGKDRDVGGAWNWLKWLGTPFIFNAAFSELYRVFVAT
jgi:hypothetical protein